MFSPFAAPYIPYTVVVTAISINDDVGPPNSIDFFAKEGSELINVKL